MGWRNRLLGAAAVAGVGVVAARTVEKRAVKALKGRVDERLDPLYDLPADVVEHDIPTHDGGSVHVVERGSGRPLVLVHGILLQAAVWAPQLHLMADRYRVVAIDVRGHGQSIAGTAGYGTSAAAQDVVTVLEHLDLRHAIVMGQSMGGAITMRMAGDHPDVLAERVDGLGFMATSGLAFAPVRLAPIAQGLGGRLSTRIESGRRIPELPQRDNDLSWWVTRVAFGAKPSAKAVDQVRQYVMAVPQATSLPTAADLFQHDAREALAATHTPSLVLVGTRDLLTPVYAARFIADALPNARLEILPDAGHQLMQERPFEVAEILDDFASQLPALDAAPAVAAPTSNGRSHAG